MLGLRELLSVRSFDLSARTKVVRHLDNECDLLACERRWPGFLDTYQRYQDRRVFDDCNYIVSCVGLPRSKARLFGLFEVVGDARQADAISIPENAVAFESQMNQPGFFTKATGWWYNLQPVRGFDDLNHRVVIDWDGVATSWHRWLDASNDKAVVEVLPAGYVYPFPGYHSVLLSHADLQMIVAAPEANREWHQMLRGIAAVYLILDTREGKQYVGSAYGQDGLLGRWTEYAKSGHGDNKQLVALLEADSVRVQDFQYTILETLPSRMTRDEVIARESFHKKRLGCRAFGLNCN